MQKHIHIYTHELTQKICMCVYMCTYVCLFLFWYGWWAWLALEETRTGVLRNGLQWVGGLGEWVAVWVNGVHH